MMKRTILTILFFSLLTCIWAQRDTYIERLNQQYTSGLFQSDNAYILVPMDDPVAVSSFNVFHYLQGRVPGLQIYGSLTFSPFVQYRFARPALFLDEMRVDAQLLSSIHMNDIALIKVFRMPFAGAVGGGNGGAIAVYTKRGDEG